MENFLEKIAREKKEEIRRVKEQVPLAEIKKRLPMPVRDFSLAIKKPGGISVIAELKKASPSAGILRQDFEPAKLAKGFESAGASALSVLTEEKYFLGKLEYIKEVKDSVQLPVLRKDFIIDEYQIYESLHCGADAVLLIAAILSEKELMRFINVAKELRLSALVEVHSEEELQKTLLSGAEIIGINNRNLKTLKTDLSVTFKLIKLLPHLNPPPLRGEEIGGGGKGNSHTFKSVPEGKILVSESGIKTADDVKCLKDLGVHAILVGETLMKSPDPAEKLKELMKCD